MGILRQLAESGQLLRLGFESFTRNNEVGFLGIRPKYPPVLAAQRVIRKDVKGILAVENNGEGTCFADLNLLH